MVVVVVGIGWAVQSSRASNPASPYTGDFGIPTLDRATGRVSASGAIANRLAHTASFRVWLGCNAPRRSMLGFSFHSRLITIGPGGSSPWTARSAPLRYAAAKGRPSTRVPASKLAHLGTWVNCAVWIATPGVSK